jgi:short-subunit dehydrogenase
MKISNKTILITGASDGIGRSIALALAKHNVSLILAGRDNIKLEYVKGHCESLGSKVKILAFDITDNASRESIIKSVIHETTVDILINNAGIWHKSTPLGSLSSETIESIISTNLTAQILLTRSLIDDMKQRESAILNNVSSAGMQGRAGRTAYAASKYGMRGFTEALRDESKGSPIRIGAVFQSGTNTQMFVKADEDMPLEKYSEPDDLAEVILFMLTRPPKLWLNEVHVTY